MNQRRQTKNSGLSALELVITLSVIIAAYGIYLYNVGGHDPVHVKGTATTEHIKTIQYLIESQKIELGCRPKSILAMTRYETYRGSGNSCGTRVFNNPWNGPYLGELKFTKDNQSPAGRVLLDYIHKGYYGELTDNGECYYVRLNSGAGSPLSVTLAPVVAGKAATTCTGTS